MPPFKVNRRGQWRRRHAACIALALLAAACGSGDEAGSDSNTTNETGAGSEASESEVGDTLTLAVGAPPTLNPYLAPPNPYNVWVLSLAYGALTHTQPDLTQEPGLAESYAYTDDRNMVFEIQLRPDLKFADGTPLDADAVVASLQHFRETGLNAQTWGGSIDSITATGPLTVRILNSTPNPDLPFVLSQSAMSGMVISPAGLADPDILNQATFGAGPYVLDASETVANDHYVFTPNPHYWDPSSRHWNRIVVRVIPDPNSAVQAIQAGQVDYTAGAVNLLPHIEAAGLPYSTGPAGVIGLILADREGSLVPALQDQRVRQALNYAIDREAILGALYAGHGTPTSQVASPGFDGFDADSNGRYAHDPEEARALLTEAGFADGFAIDVLTQPFIGQDSLAQAVTAQWEAIGVTVNLTSVPQVPQYFEQAMSRSFPVLTFGVLGAPLSLTSTSLMLPTPNPNNPFATADDEMTRLLTTGAATSDDADRAGIYREAMARLVDLAWFAPVVQVDGVAVGSARITDFETSDDKPFTDVLRIRPA